MICERCQAQVTEGFYCIHCGLVPPRKVSLDPDRYAKYRSRMEIDEEEHFEAFLNGDTDDCYCSRCREWREQERRDYENV